MDRLMYKNESGIAAVRVYNGQTKIEVLTKVFEKLFDLEDKIERGEMIELPCKPGDTVYKIWYKPCKYGNDWPDGMECDGCEGECDLKRAVFPVTFQTLAQIMESWSKFESGWYYKTEAEANTALEAQTRHE